MTFNYFFFNKTLINKKFKILFAMKSKHKILLSKWTLSINKRCWNYIYIFIFYNIYILYSLLLTHHLFSRLVLVDRKRISMNKLYYTMFTIQSNRVFFNRSPYYHKRYIYIYIYNHKLIEKLHYIIVNIYISSIGLIFIGIPCKLINTILFEMLKAIYLLTHRFNGFH